MDVDIPARRRRTNTGRRGLKDKSNKKTKSGTCCVDFAKFDMASLLKYRSHFNLDVRPRITKTDLISVVRKHFVQHPKLRDAETISAFLFSNINYLEELDAQANAAANQ